MIGDLGTALSELRLAAGLSLDRMGRELGLPADEIAAVENMTRVFTESRPVLDWLSVCGADAEAPRIVGLWRKVAQASGVEF